MRIAAIGDLHVRTNTTDLMPNLLKDVEQKADLLVLAGDLTDTGQPAEMEILLDQLKPYQLPIVAVLGNHDHESDQADTLLEMMKSAGLYVLEANAFEIDGVGFVGTKGFCGGFDNLFVMPFGERALKSFIQTSIDEAMRLENAAAKLDCKHKVAVLHYAPIKETLMGEAAELFPFLGTSRLANALDRKGVDVIFHGHAHRGYPMGHTTGKIPVYNVSRFVQQEHTGQPYCLYTL